MCVTASLAPVAGAVGTEPESVTQKLRIAVISDDHYLSPELIAATDDYTTDLNSDRKVFTESDAFCNSREKY